MEHYLFQKRPFPVKHHVQVKVWWKLWGGGGLEIHWSSLCNVAMGLWMVCPSLSSKKMGSCDSSGPNRTPYSNFWVIKGTWWSWWGSEAVRYLKLCLLTVSYEWKYAFSLIRKLFGKSGFSVSIPWKKNEIESEPVCPDHSKNVQFGMCGSVCRVRRTRMSDMPHAWAPRTATDGRPTPGQCCRLCELRTADQVAFYSRQSLLHATALPLDGLDLEMGGGFYFYSFRGEIRTWSLQLTPSE